MDQYSVTGMSCAACQSRVEKAVSRVPGVTACSVSLLTNSMGVEGTAEPGEIIRAVKAAGYGASRHGWTQETKDWRTGIEKAFSNEKHRAVGRLRGGRMDCEVIHLSYCGPDQMAAGPDMHYIRLSGRLPAALIMPETMV